jgi:PAS domain S-box-containing protein
MLASNDVIWECNCDANIMLFSDNFQHVFGYPPPEDFNLERWQELIHPDDRRRVVSSLDAARAAGGKLWSSEHRVRRADGSYVHVFDRASVLYGNGGKLVRLVGVSIDVTQRKRSEEKIREQAELLDKASDAIILCDLERRIIFWNQGAERLYGWNATEVNGQNLGRVLFREDPPPQIEEAIKYVREKGEWIGELQEFTKDGKPAVVQARATLIRDAQGQAKSLLIINTDITERKKLEEQFLRAQRLDSLGALVSGIAHDLNNALSPILMGVSMVRTKAASKEDENIFAMIDTSARRGADMVKQVLAFARGGETKRIAIHLDQLVKEMGKIIADVFPKNIKCRVVADRSSWPVFGIATQLHQVLMNLCVNARDAMPQGGTLTIQLKNVHIDSSQTVLHPDAKPGDYLCASVRDTGTGIPSELLDKIFQPFYTTKAPGKGTGLGLSTSGNIVKNHGGFMTVVSEASHGTEFSFYLPACVGRPPVEAIQQQAQLPQGSGECVLVVDDEEAVLALMRTILENYGYRVITAASGPEAVACLAENRNSVNLVITDLSMPFMDGEATIIALRKVVTNIRVIATSGLDDERKGDTQRLTKTSAFIQKPFTAESLLIAVHQGLAG